MAAQRAAKLMVTQKDGLIVNISSAGALLNFFTAPYGVGKAGVSLMKCVHNETRSQVYSVILYQDSALILTSVLI